MVLKRIGVWSAAKILGVLYAVIGILIGLLFTLISLVGPGGPADESGMGFLFGTSAVVFLPIFYGVVGLVSGAIGTALYNLVARVIGGFELEFEE